MASFEGSRSPPGPSSPGSTRSLPREGDSSLLSEILNTVCQEAQALLGGTGACVNELIPGDAQLEIRAASGSLADHVGDRYSLEESVSGTVVTRREPVVENDIASSSRGGEARRLGVPVERVVSVPLEVEGAIVGTLVVVRKGPGEAFGPEHVRMLSAFARPVALTIRSEGSRQAERARAQGFLELSRARKNEVRQLFALHDAALAVTAETDLEELLHTIAEQARRLLGARYGALGVMNEEGTGLRRFITAGITPEERQRYGDPPTGKGLLGAVIEEGRPIRTSDVEADPRSRGTPSHHHSMTSFLGVPVRVGDRIFGNLYLTNKEGGEEFTEDDEAVLQMLAMQAAVAIQTARNLEERNQFIARLERSRKLRNRLVAFVSHDIRNALSGVVLWSGRLREKLADGGVSRDEILPVGEKIQRGSRHSLRLIRDVLDLARLEEDRLETWPRPVPVADLVTAVKDGITPEAEDREIRLEAEVDPGDLRIVADPDRVVQILLNLVSNAVKFSPEGKAVRIEAREVEGGPPECDPPEDADPGERRCVAITVQDSGPGIRSEDLDRIFQEYEMLGKDPTERRGSGIGLTLSRKLAHLLGGEITVESSPGEGSRFVLWLPAGKEPRKREGWVG